MKQVTICLIVIMVGTAMTALGVSGVIGVAVSNGKMEVNRSEVTGNANLSDGAMLRSITEPLRIQWSGGGSAALGPHSAAQVYGDRLVLQAGQGVVGTPAVRAVAKGYEVQAEAQSQAQLALHDGMLQVAALSGTVKVRGADGMMLARVSAGQALDFVADSSAGGVSTMRGTLRGQDGRFFLKDELTNLDVEVRGASLQPSVGRLVEVSGKAAPSADRQSQVIEMARLTTLETDPQSGGSQPTTGSNSKTKTKARRGAGMSSGNKVLITTLVLVGAAGVAVPLAVMSR